ncbi:MAG: polysaccharide biosynthesis/export family protein [Nitrospirota bacterium]
MIIHSFLHNRFLGTKTILPFFIMAVVVLLVGCAADTYQMQTESPLNAQTAMSTSTPETTLATAAAPSVATSTPSEPLSDYDSITYVLGPEDVVQVLVWKDETLTRTVMVRPDGKISLPLVGELVASGLTPSQLSGSVRDALRKYYKEQPEVSVIVTEINSFSVFVLGQVVIPGKHVLRRETTMLQMLSLAGGFKEYANTKKILLLRREGGFETRVLVNYKRLITGDNPEENLILKPGDTIIVP